MPASASSLRLLLLLALLAATLSGCESKRWIDEPLGNLREEAPAATDPYAEGAFTLRVERGMTGRQIGRALAEAGVLPSPRHFVRLLRVTGGGERLRAGVYRVTPGMTPRELVALLQSPTGGGIRLTLVEGWTTAQMASAVVQAGVVSSEQAFLDAVAANPKRASWMSNPASTEGFLFPDTYNFFPGQTPEEVVAQIVNRFERRVNVASYEASAEAVGLTLEQAVTLASIIEREAKSPDERPEMAGVFLNRLESEMRLESCATVNYALGDWSRTISVADTEIEHPFNTYQILGLPPGPICNPGLASLHAAVGPSETDNLFFVFDPTQGRHRFSRTFAEHQRAVREVRRLSQSTARPSSPP